MPALGLEFDVKKGEQIIEFTPAEGYVQAQARADHGEVCGGEGAGH